MTLDDLTRDELEALVTRMVNERLSTYPREERDDHLMAELWRSVLDDLAEANPAHTERLEALRRH